MRVMTARDAAALVKDGDTVAICGIVSLLAVEEALRALGERFRETGSPRDLCVVCPNGTGWSAGGAVTGLDHLAQPGMVKRLITSILSARAFGLAAQRVTDPKDIAPALRQGFASGIPNLIDDRVADGFGG